MNIDIVGKLWNLKWNSLFFSKSERLRNNQIYYALGYVKLLLIIHQNVILFLNMK